MQKNTYIPLAKIPENLDIKQGDIVLIASDITRLAFGALRHEKRFDAKQLINAFQKKLGAEGTLLFPAYTFHYTDGATFDPVRSVPITGALSETVFRRSDFCRTRHPLHSFMVWGKEAEHFCELDNGSSFGDDSPFALLHQLDAKMLLIGTSVGAAFTFTHYVEQSEKVGYRRNIDLKINYADKTGQSAIKTYSIFRKKAGWNMVLHRLDALFANNALQTVRNIARFELKLLLKDVLKFWLKKFKIYQSATDKISDGTDL